MTKSSLLKLAVAGCTGRMGQLLLKEIACNSFVDIGGALTRVGNPFVGIDVGAFIGHDPFNLTIVDSPALAFKDADVVIDFSKNDALGIHLQEVLKQKKPFIVCTTGLSEEQIADLEAASKAIPLIMAPNTSLAIALLRKLSLIAADVLGSSYDVSLLEMHHRSKVDAPSGTTLSIAESLKSVSHLQDNTPPYPLRSPRPINTLECATLRGGGIAGEHTVIFTGAKDMLKLEHRALTPSLFAQGALRAAEWLYDKPSGFYTMDNVVGLR